MTRRLIFPLLYFFLLATLLFLPVFVQGKIPINSDLIVSFYEPWKTSQTKNSFKPLGFDDIRIFYPQRIFTIDRLRAGHLPIWDPYIFSGNVHLANSQTSVFYPLFWIFLVFPPTVSWTILSMSVPFLSGFLMFFFLQQKVSKISALFGATAYALSGIILVRTEDGIVAGHSAIWLPLAFLAIDKIATNRKTFGTSLLILSLVLTILAGWFQYTFYILVMSFAYALYRRVSITRIIIIFGVVVGLTSVHLLPAIQALMVSPRGDSQIFDLTKHLMPIWHTITYVVPDFFGHPANYTYFGKSEYKEGMLYVGIWPFIFAIVAFWKSKQSNIPKFFIISALITLFLGIEFPGLAGVLSKLPLVSSFLPNRIFFINTFMLTVASAYGLEALLANRRVALTLKKIVTLLCVIFAVVVLGIVAVYVNEKILIAVTKFSFFQLGAERYLLLILGAVRESLLVLSGGGLALLLFTRRRISLTWFMVAIIILTIAHQVVFVSRYFYFSNPKNLFPADPVISFLQNNTKSDYSRFVTLGDARFTSNTSLYYKLYDVEGVDALYPIWYGEFFGFMQSHGESLNVQDRISTWFAPTISREKDWSDPFVINFLKLTGVKYLVTKNNFPVDPPRDRFTLTYNSDNWKIWQYNSFVPKVEFVSQYEIIANKNDHLKRLFEPGFDPTKSVVLFESPGIQSTMDGNGLASLSSYSPEKIIIDVNALNPGLVVVNDTYYPNWRALVDGAESTIYRANYTFRAISIGTGHHTIEMDFNYLSI